MDIITIVGIGLQIIGGASILLKMIAPYTETKKDDKIVKVLDKILKSISLDTNTKLLQIKLK